MDGLAMIEQCGTLRLSRSRLRHNLKVLRGHIGEGTEICAVVKANAYGHGVGQIVDMLEPERLPWLAAYSRNEGDYLLHAGRAEKVLVLSPLVITDPAPYGRSGAYALTGGLRLNISDIATARNLGAAFSQSVVPEQLRIPIHMQIDVGLTRAGVHPDEAGALAEAIATLPGMRLEGVFGHLSHGDVPGHPTLAEQCATFFRVAGPLREKYPGLLLHLQNSGGAVHLRSEAFAKTPLNFVRVGIAMYGLQPSTKDLIAGLLPIAEVTAPILAIHERAAGAGVGYGHTFVTRRASRLAVVPVGYADGYPRQLSGTAGAVVQVRGQVAPVVGRVSMDQIVVDVTDVAAARLGDQVTVISKEAGAPNSLDKMADAVGTIGYELATHLGGRLRREVVE